MGLTGSLPVPFLAIGIGCCCLAAIRDVAGSTLRDGTLRDRPPGPVRSRDELARSTRSGLIGPGPEDQEATAAPPGTTTAGNQKGKGCAWRGFTDYRRKDEVECRDDHSAARRWRQDSRGAQERTDGIPA
jgi:hypothetical protein